MRFQCIRFLTNKNSQTLPDQSEHRSRLGVKVRWNSGITNQKITKKPRKNAQSKTKKVNVKD